jgi:hypothetical protein
MRTKLVTAAATLTLLALVLSASGGASPTAAAGAGDKGPDDARFSVGLWGDVPYDAVQESRIAPLTRDMNKAGLAFSVFVGDIKSGSSPCDDASFTKAITRFDAFESPMVYVPGDNEWTDCHRIPAGGYNGLERLAQLRKVMFASSKSFGMRKMALQHQSAAYPENTRWTRSSVVFVGINVPGSNNNKVNTPEECTTGSARTQADCDADNAEYAARDAVVRQWVHESFEMAKTRHAAAIMIVMQADPGFDLPETSANERTDPGVDGYTNLLATLVDETRAFGGQVALVHGDTHYFTIDKPLVDQAHLLPNLTRVETFGNPNVQWVKATIDPRNRNVFTFEPEIVPGS